MEKFSVNEVIEQAVQTERLGYQFYSSMAKKFEKDEGLSKLFSTLAEKELQHEKIFEDLKKAVEDNAPAGWDEVSRYLRAIVESEFFLGKNKALPNLEHVKTIKDAVKFAMGFEKETLLYYYALKDALKEKDTMEKIIAEEKSHIVWLSMF